MSDDVVIRFKGHFDKSIPDFFEELWSLVAIEDNEQPNTTLCGENEERHQYYTQRGSTGIVAWSLENRLGFGIGRTLKIEYEDEDANYYQMVLHHHTNDGKYKLAMPLAPTLEGPFDE